ncbi:peptidoglycan-binding protein [Streptomyces sp. YIM 98790]|uniref:L,D-transpeptidase family protein n=1 Tax=Streptomyces sp. YIM 98790 TaxID=2689077 RepID=UPI001409D7E6|nr:peptidoglycan-binding protein [Streptomyces sp. YIM 98790]
MRSAHTARTLGRSLAALAAAALLLTACGSGGSEEPDAKPVANETTPDPSPEETASEEPEEEPEPEPTPTETPDPVLYQAGDNSGEVRELQARLAQAGHFAAQPTGFYGEVTTGAVAAYQESKEELEVSGVVHQSTWDLLLSETTEPTEEELFPKQQVMGYGDNNDQVRELQARLKQLDHFDEDPTGYYGNVTTASVKSYQEAAGLEVTGTVYEDTWDLLKSQTRNPTEDELRPPVEVPEADEADESSLDPRCMKGRVLCISKTTSQLVWMIDGEVQLTLDVRFGAEGYETREGEFTVYWKSRDHHSTLYDSPMPFAMFFDGGQAVHYSENFRQNGYNGGSYGCVNVRDYDSLEWLFDEVREGDKVVIYW